VISLLASWLLDWIVDVGFGGGYYSVVGWVIEVEGGEGDD
jgi:hypothetical protein